MFEVKKAGLYDYVLALATILLLVALSAVSIYGTVESWVNSARDPSWTSGYLYADYLNRMNSYAYPFAVALIIVLCMCIPKRFVSRSYLLQSSIILLSLSAIAGVIWGFTAGLGFLLVISVIVQAVVALMVVARSKRLVFEREGLMVQLGSALLHLGFVIFVLDLVLIRDIPVHLGIFWLSTALLTIGSVLSFYSKELSLVLRRSTDRENVEEADGVHEDDVTGGEPAASELVQDS